QGGRRHDLAALPARHAAADRQRAVRHRAAALDLHVHQVRHGVADGRRRRREPLRAHAAGVRLRAQLHLSAGRDGRRPGPADGRAPAGGGRGVLPRVPARGGGGVKRALALYGGGLVLLVIGAFPLAWMLSTALKPSGEIFATPPTLLPRVVTLENFQRLFEET